MYPSRITRREFMSRSAAAAAGVFLSACTGSRLSTNPTPRPTFGTDPLLVDTRWPIKRVVYVMLENRSFDNLFGRFPGANGASSGVRWGSEVPLVDCPEWLPGDLPHDLTAWLDAYNRGLMDGFAQGEYGPYYSYSSFPDHEIPTWFHWAENYVLCDNFFASAAGPSFNNHLFWISGQSGGAIDNPENIKVRRVPDPAGSDDPLIFKSWGCDAYGDDVFVLVRDEVGNITKHTTCFRIPTVGEQLSEGDVDWASYSANPFQAGYIWQAYSAIEPVFRNQEMWDEHIWPVDDLFRDIEADALPSVTWVTPRFQLSDHPPFSTKHAMNWVTDIVNRIMKSDMWEHTAIFITWDEWGGLYDHVTPPKIDSWDLGFRVPMLVISPYAKKGYIDDAVGEFTAPLRFIADNWDLPYLTDRFEKVHNFEHVFDFKQKPRPPDPRPKVQATNAYHDFPEEFPEWPPELNPAPPKIRFP
jgi:phospholipase C